MYRLANCVFPVLHSLFRRYHSPAAATRPCFTAPRTDGLMRAVQPDGAGSVSVVEVPIPAPSTNARLMKVCAVGVNRADLLQIAGKYPAPKGATATLGLEAAGFLDDGRRATALLTHGAFAEYCLVPRDALLYLNDAAMRGYTMAQLAAIPEAFVAAFHIMFDVGRLQLGQSVLLNAAASGVGVAAIQLAATLPDVTVIASVRSDAKLDLLQRRLSSSATAAAAGSSLHLFNCETHPISDVVAQVTDGRGVHLALDCVGPAQFKHIERALARNGIWVMYGLLSGAKGDRVGLAGIVSKHLSVRGTTLRSRSADDRAGIISRFVDRFGHCFGGIDSSSGTASLQPVIHTEMSGLESAADAFKMLENNENVGKIVVTL